MTDTIANDNAPKKPSVYGGLDLPTIDFYAPSREELREGLADILAQLKPELLKNGRENSTWEEMTQAIEADKFARNNQHIQHVLIAHQELAHFEQIIKENFSGGQKPTLQGELLDTVEDIFNDFRAAARSVNEARHALEIPGDMNIRRMGGTINNKLQVLKAGRGDNIEAVLFGAVGRDNSEGNRTFIDGQLAEMSINRVPPDLEMQETKHSFIYITETGERVALKAPAADLKELLKDRKEELVDFVKSLDTVLIEGSAGTDSKFGEEIFNLMARTAMENNKQIIFGAPTEPEIIFAKTEADIPRVERNKQMINELIDYRNTTVINMNETEAAMLFSSAPAEAFMGKDDQKVKITKDHPYLDEALDIIQQRMAAKKADLILNHKEGDQLVEPVAFVSVGKDGVYAVTATKIEFEPAPDVKRENIKDTLGAGDNLAAGILIKRNQLWSKIKETVNDLVEFTTDQLKSMLGLGQDIATAVIQQKGAQLPSKKIGEIVMGDAKDHAVGEGQSAEKLYSEEQKRSRS